MHGLELYLASEAAGNFEVSLNNLQQHLWSERF
jgi:hypothetical protein